MSAFPGHTRSPKLGESQNLIHVTWYIASRMLSISNVFLILARDKYRSTVLTAFQNVAGTLQALQQDADGLKAASAAKDAAAVTLDLTRKQLESGYTNYLALLSAEQAYQQALFNLAQAQANRYADTAALFQALGGG
ncbi:MAG: TolC family protein [Terriglobia bacterium]